MKNNAWSLQARGQAWQHCGFPKLFLDRAATRKPHTASVVLHPHPVHAAFLNGLCWRLEQVPGGLLARQQGAVRGAGIVCPRVLPGEEDAAPDGPGAAAKGREEAERQGAGEVGRWGKSA